MSYNRSDNLNNMEFFDAAADRTITKDSTPQEVLDYIVLTIMQRVGQEDLAFKGGYMLNQLMPSVSRMTRDVDFSVVSDIKYEKIKDELRIIGDYLQQVGAISSYRIKDTITPTSSGGIDFYDSNGGKYLGVDVGWHQLRNGTKWYDLSIGHLHAFSVERMLSDKVHAIFTPKRFRRTKDLYDVYYLLENFDVDYKVFKQCIEDRGPLDLQKSPFREEVLVQYKHAWDKLNVVSAITNERLEKPEFRLVIERLAGFVLALSDNHGDNIYWDKERIGWYECS